MIKRPLQKHCIRAWQINDITKCTRKTRNVDTESDIHQETLNPLKSVINLSQIMCDSATGLVDFV